MHGVFHNCGRVFYKNQVVDVLQQPLVGVISGGTLIAATTGKKIVLLGGVFSFDVSGRITVWSGAVTTGTRIISSTQGSVNLPIPSSVYNWGVGGTSEAFLAELATASNVNGVLIYCLVV